MDVEGGTKRGGEKEKGFVIKWRETALLLRAFFFFFLWRGGGGYLSGADHCLHTLSVKKNKKTPECLELRFHSQAV